MSDTTADKIATSFARLGWTGVSVQVVLMLVPIVITAYAFFGLTNGMRDRFGFTEYLAVCGLLILAFTTFWSFYYTRLSNRIRDPERRPTRDSIVKILWVGLWAGTAGIVVSLVALIVEVVRLLILLLKAPQGGIPVFRTEPDSRTGWISAIDAVSLLADVCTLAGEFLLLGLTLWLLFKITQFAADYDHLPVADEAALPAT